MLVHALGRLLAWSRWREAQCCLVSQAARCGAAWQVRALKGEARGAADAVTRLRGRRRNLTDALDKVKVRARAQLRRASRSARSVLEG